MEWELIPYQWKTSDKVCVRIRGVAFRSTTSLRLPENTDINLEKDETLTGINFQLYVVKKLE
jgi:hypothetical protein